MASTVTLVLVLSIICFGQLALPASSAAAGHAGATMELREDLRLMEICQACLVDTFSACFDFRPAKFAACFVKYIIKEKCIGMVN
ncbi:hypothetical protein ZWY2020_025965 [Hordeum vulgare]|nr:hypothetical protein ZWY2020_025965 [Hordeum vulgare]